jgi:hypothetical protein
MVIMRPFLITARTAAGRITFSALARSSCDAADLAVDIVGDEPCVITVFPGAC